MLYGLCIEEGQHIEGMYEMPFDFHIYIVLYHNRRTDDIRDPKN